MLSKLTLSVDQSVIEQAKKYAKSTGRSLSEMVETYLQSIIEEQPKQTRSVKLKKISGVVKLPANFDEEKELRAYYEQKHL